MAQYSNTTNATTAAHWDWKHQAVTVPLEAFVMYDAPTLAANDHGLKHFWEYKYYVSACYLQNMKPWLSTKYQKEESDMAE
ncbi:hypothetical protein KW478_06085 [Vibrio fluvialis]|nr:hypothetical protein [Vibrio fluvialis]